MRNGEPPFGYGGDGLSQRTKAGLPRETSSKDVAPVGAADGLVNPGANVRNEKAGADSDEPRFLPIVR